WAETLETSCSEDWPPNITATLLRSDIALLLFYIQSALFLTQDTFMFNVYFPFYYFITMTSRGKEKAHNRAKNHRVFGSIILKGYFSVSFTSYSRISPLKTSSSRS